MRSRCGGAGGGVGHFGGSNERAAGRDGGMGLNDAGREERVDILLGGARLVMAWRRVIRWGALG